MMWLFLKFSLFFLILIYLFFIFSSAATDIDYPIMGVSPLNLQEIHGIFILNSEEEAFGNSLTWLF